MKVIIAGSRSITDKKFVFETIDTLNLDITEVVCGMARGIDQIGKEWAESKGIKVVEMHYMSEHGRAGGPIRNGRMAEYADNAIVFWDGKSKGSKNMIEWMRKLGKPCHVVLYE